MTLNAKTIWTALAIAGLALGLCFSGCTTPHGAAPEDSNIEQPDATGMNGAVVATNMSQGITLTFPTNITAELQSLLTAAGIQTPTPTLAIVSQVTTDAAQRRAIAASIKAGAQITELK